MDKDIAIEMLMIKVDLLKEALNKINMDIRKIDLELNRIKSPYSVAQRREESLAMYKAEYERCFGTEPTYDDGDDEDMID